MKIFLTGATGSIGQSVLKALNEDGHEVTCLVRKYTKLACTRQVRGTLEDAQKFAKEIKSADAVIHLANTRTTEYKKVVTGDILGTAKMLDFWEKGNFIFMSTQTVYGKPNDILREDTAYSPENWYDLGKTCNELQLQLKEKKPERGVTVSLRMPLLMPGRGTMSKEQFVYNIYYTCKNRGVFVVESEEGYEKFGSSFIGIHDVARGIINSLDITRQGSYNFTTGFLTWKDLINGIGRILGIKPNITFRKEDVIYDGEFRLPRSVSLLDGRKLEMESSYRPLDNLQKLLEEYVFFMEKY